MNSSVEIVNLLNDLPSLSNYLKENHELEFDDSIYSTIAKHLLDQPVTIESLSVQRNLYGRLRSTNLNSIEIDLFIFNLKQSLNSNSKDLIKIFLQYLHNLTRLLPSEYFDLSYLCSIALLDKGETNVLACIFCAFIEKHLSKTIRFDLIINHLFTNENENSPWIEQLTKLIIDNDRLWLREFYLKKIYQHDFLQAIDRFDKQNIFHLQPIQQQQQLNSKKSIEFNCLNDLSDLNEIHLKLKEFVENSCPIEQIEDECLINLFSKLTNYPDDLHLLFSCLLINNFNRNYFNEINLRLFRRLIHLLDNYYLNQQDLFDDNQYRLLIVYLLSKYLCELHRRRSSNEHDWYKLYVDVPKDHPLPTFDLYSDLLCLLSTLTYGKNECQDEIRLTEGTIESILSMTQIDINQPKAQACVTWLLKCLTESNEENRNYIKQIK